MVSDSKRGFALLYFLIFLLLTAMISLYLHSSARRTMLGRNAHSSELKALLQSNNQSTKILSFIDRGGSPHDAGALASHGGTLHELSKHGRLYELRVGVTAGFAISPTSYQLTLNRETADDLAKPDWGELAALSSSGSRSSFCLDWHRGPLGGLPGFSSERSCIKTQSRMRTNTYISGNLVLNKPFVIKGLRNRTVRLAVLGDISLANDIHLSQLRNVRVEMIAFGPVKVRSIHDLQNSSVKLLIHSVTGAVEIESWDPALLGCGPTQSLAVTLEGAGGFTLGGKDQGNIRRLGCDYPRNSAKNWPKFKILGFGTNSPP